MPFRKGTPIYLGLTYVHYHPLHWREPEKYVPERFDPTSPWFKTPDGKNRHPCTFMPFSFGPRNCPGQIIAFLEMRVFITYLLLKLDFKLDLEPELKDCDHVSFAVSTPNKLHVRVTKVN